MSYDQDHVTYDAHDTPLTIHCVKCHAIIGRRDESPSRTPGVAVHSLVRSTNYREVYAELSDGSVCYFPVCTDCIREPLDGNAALDVVKRGWIAALEHQTRPQEAIDAQNERVANLTVTKVGRTD